MPILSKEIVAASSRPLLLSLLKEGESYGYELIKRLRELSNGEMEWTEGTLYPVLHRLEREAWVQASWHEAESGRQRKYYKLTAVGRRALLEEKSQWMFLNQLLETLWKRTST